MSQMEGIRRRAAETAATAGVLRAMDEEDLIARLADAADLLADRETETGAEARGLLVQSTGLSAEMVDWALETAVGGVTRGALHSLSRSLTPPNGATISRARLAALVLSGNVFTASLRAMLVPLLARVPVIAKASSRDDVFPRLLRRAIELRAPEVAASVEVLTFEGGNVKLEDALFAQADMVAAYGSDATLAEIRARLPATTTFVPHGHGLGAIYVPFAGGRTDIDEVASQIALDVAAYDQRGCLSPHAVWTDAKTEDARALAEAIAEALERLRTELPRGPLPMDRGAQQLQWRGVGATRGDLFEGDGYAVCFEGDAPLRLSPGHRNVAVLSCADEEDLGRRLSPLGVHLKALGIAADIGTRRAIARRLPAPLAPRISAVGQMQTPGLTSLADGQSPWLGLVRFTQVD